MAVTHGQAETTWGDFRLEDGYSDDEIKLDLSALGPFDFPREPYRAALLAPVGMLDALTAADREAELHHRRSRTLRGLWQRLSKH